MLENYQQKAKYYAKWFAALGDGKRIQVKLSATEWGEISSIDAILACLRPGYELRINKTKRRN